MFYDIEFTRKAFDAAKLKDGESQTEYRVKGKEHLRLIVYNTKKALYVRHCYKGLRKGKKMGTYPLMTLPTFERLANEFCEHLESGELNSLARRVTYADFFMKVYLATAKAKGKKTWKDDLSRFNLYINSCIGSIILADIKPYHIQALLNNLPTHLSDRSHDLIRALISVSFSVAIKFELVDKNPCRATSALNNCNVITRHMAETELTEFLQSALTETNVDSKNFSFHTLCILLALFTGIRIENTQSITRSMIAEDGGSILLPHTKPDRAQRIYLSEQAQWLVQQATKVSWSEYVFPSTVNRDSYISYPRSTFIRICRRAGIACAGSSHEINSAIPNEPLKIHCLRKSFGTYVLNTTSDMELARVLLGHSNIAVTQRHYAFHQNTRLIDAVKLTSDALTAQIPNFPRIKNS